MARLFSNHDPFHIHAILGFIAIGHFFYRLYLIITINNAFPNPSWIDVVLVMVHGALPIASIILPLPKRRNFNDPMIWPEFRMHSVTFACRHVVATVYWLCRKSAVPTDGMYDMNVWDLVMMLALTHLTMHLATMITDRLGCYTNRTTNAMPYDPTVPEYTKLRAKRMYAYAQFMATSFAFVGDPTIAWIPLCGIQSAPFLMTLVRKGKASACTSHSIYAWTLILPQVVMRHVSYRLGMLSLNLAYMTGGLAFWMRTRWGCPKHVAWVVSPALILLMAHTVSTSITSSPLWILVIDLVVARWQTMAIPHILLRPSKHIPVMMGDIGLPILMLGYLSFVTFHIMVMTDPIRTFQLINDSLGGYVLDMNVATELNRTVGRHVPLNIINGTLSTNSLMQVDSFPVTFAQNLFSSSSSEL